MNFILGDSRKWCLLMFVFIFVLGSFSVKSLNVCGQTEEETKLVEARTAVSEAFVAVHTAESQGANVTDLVAQLNLAAGLLETAEIAFRTGDFQNASLLADQCLGKVDGVVSSAVALGNEAESARVSQLNFSLLVASIGLSVLFVASLFGWRLLRGYYVKRSLRLKPGLVQKD